MRGCLDIAFHQCYHPWQEKKLPHTRKMDARVHVGAVGRGRREIESNKRKKETNQIQAEPREGGKAVRPDLALAQRDPNGNFADRYGSRFVKLVDSRESGKEFEFDQVLLMPTAAGYRALVEQAKIEISPRIMQYLSRRWSEGP